jgi:hypothetical protein
VNSIYGALFPGFISALSSEEGTKARRDPLNFFNQLHVRCCLPPVSQRRADPSANELTLNTIGLPDESASNALNSNG